MEKIAVVVDRQGLSSTFFDGSCINIYCKTADGWKCLDSSPIIINPQEGMQSLRQSLMELLRSLETCKVIVGHEISGLPYNIFDAAGFNIFQVEGTPESFLEEVHEMLMQDTTQHTNMEIKLEGPVKPEPTGIEGHYRINLVDIQKNHPQVSSKQILLPFLRNTCFYELEVICSHVPPWFETELAPMSLKKTVEELGPNLYKVTLHYMPCCS